MSGPFDRMNWAVAQEGTASQKHVLLLLAVAASEDGYCFPGQDLLAKRSGLSRETVNRSLTALTKNGLIVSRRRKKSGRPANEYLLLYRPDLYWPSGEPGEVAQEDGHFGRDDGHEDVTQDHINRTDDVTEDHMSCDGGSHLDVTEDHTKEPRERTKEQQVRGLWDCFVETRNSEASPVKIRSTKLEKAERKMIEDALSIAPYEDWLLAVPNLLKSDYHCGRAPGNDKKYLGPEHAFGPYPRRRGDGGTVKKRLEWLMSMGSPVSPQIPGGELDVTGATDTIRQAVKAVREGEGLAGSSSLALRGQRAEQWLSQQGIRVVRDNGQLRFITD